MTTLHCLASHAVSTEGAAVIEVVNDWREHFTSAGVAQSDLESWAEWLDGEERLSQRTGFDAAKFQTSPARRKRSSLFQRT